MVAEFRTIPDVLSHVGTELVNHGRALAGLQMSCQRDADGVQLGWVGSSADALSALLDRWETTSAGHLARFGDHADGMKAAAVAFLEMDRHNAGLLR